MSKIDHLSFWLGVLATLVIVGFVALIHNHRRHCCFSCSRGTKKICRIFVHDSTLDTPSGFRMVSEYVFHQCLTCAVVRVKVVDRLMEDHVIKGKPKHEFDFASDDIRTLFKLAPHVHNPNGVNNLIRPHVIGRRHVAPLP